VNAGHPGNDGETLLPYATWLGDEGVVKILLGCGRLIPTYQMITAERHFHVPLGVGMREWGKYYLGGGRSTPTCLMITAEQRSHRTSGNMIKW